MPDLDVGYEIVNSVECFGYDMPRANVGSFFVVAICADGTEWAHFHRAERAIAPDMDMEDAVPGVLWKLLARMRNGGVSPQGNEHWGPMPVGRGVYRAHLDY